MNFFCLLVSRDYSIYFGNISKCTATESCAQPVGADARAGALSVFVVCILILLMIPTRGGTVYVLRDVMSPSSWLTVQLEGSRREVQTIISMEA